MRVADWPERLAEAVETARVTPFAWGAHDCATWACDTAAAMTGGPSAADQWRGRYSTAAGSVRVMRRLGWADVGALADACFGARIMPLMAGRGDVVLIGGAIGICVGSSVAVMGEDGMEAPDMADAVAAWRVG